MNKLSQRDSSPRRAGAIFPPPSLAKILRLGMVGDALYSLLDGRSPAQQPETASPAAPESVVPPVSEDRAPAAPVTAEASSADLPPADLPKASSIALRRASVADAKRDTEALEETVTRAFESLLSKDADAASVGSAMALVEAIVRRLQALGPGSIPDLRVYGGEGTHAINVFLLSVAIGIALEQSWDDLLSLGQAALLHDVGMAKVGRKVTLKETPLTPYEERVLERHVEYGLDILKTFQDRFSKLNQDVYQGVRSHHERWDGQGYPQGLKGRKIPLASRIIAVADYYLDRTEDHVRHTRVTPTQAYREILALSGQAFDPQVVAALREVMVLYPLHSLVELESGHVAQVVAQGRCPDLPVVQLGLGEGVLDLGSPGTPAIVRRLFPRKHPRIDLDLPAAIKSHGEAALAPSRIVNLSLGGAGIILAKPLPVGAHVTLNIVTADMQLVKVDGVVAWQSPRTSGARPMGIRFDALDPEVQKDLETLVGQARSWAWKRA